MPKKAFSFRKNDKIFKSINQFYSVSKGLMITTICQELFKHKAYRSYLTLTKAYEINTVK